MANISRAHVIKAALLASILIVLLNLYIYHNDQKIEPSTTSASFSKLSWPKRTRNSMQFLNYTKSIALQNVSQQIVDKNTARLHSNVTTFEQKPNDIPINSTNTNQMHFNVSHNISSNFTSNNNNNNNNNKNSNINNDIIRNNSLIDKIHIIDNNTEKKNNHNNTDLILNTEENTIVLENSTNAYLLDSLSATPINKLMDCPRIPLDLVGPITVNTTFEKLENLEKRFTPFLLNGGWYETKDCIARDHVAIIVPYRDREIHLPIFLQNIHPFLMRQQIDYGIFLIEQMGDGLFNRATLMNIGFTEALKLKNWDCFIFHDVDLLPLDDRNLYKCPVQPRHMSVAVDTLSYKLPYNTIFGGVSAMTVKQFRKLNGFSNSFWGWGGEDDDMSNRLKHSGFHIARYPVNIARYTMLSHKKEKANPKRYEKLLIGAKKFDVDGLNSLKYKVHKLEKKILYTWILVEIKQKAS